MMQIMAQQSHVSTARLNNDEFSLTDSSYFSSRNNMGGTTRMSGEEKRKVVLDLYHRTKTVFTEKEILTAATKAGVNANT
jgi:hypothetical protein